ncbi:alpha/beta-hydrolase [Trametes versicolor FP-101664 SS1]|uniref:alpha/beta-hydrolase n=1 Tax=Trametes versicolor (strain FP-101664) TaxID=717944 RepID=UPI0004621505|nr:alpha/beta-hydrolase [Trametes versicolor FP-101664 SS1]EIW62588.1 alpha/beta-hydrolase [Trametes versicolor FP-101664 SS1]
MDASLYKTTTVSREFTYHYYHSPATEGKPTILFVHGFPSSSYDWRRQVEHFRPQGYGIIIPDILGVGGTSKPDSADAFRFALVAHDIIDVLDTEGLKTVVGIGHDWGSVILSRLANLYSDRFYGFAWLALSYLPPAWQEVKVGGEWDETGSEGFGYWEFLTSDDAAGLCEKNLDCFLQMAYPVTPQLVHGWNLPRGKTREWVESNVTHGLPAWLPKEEYDIVKNIWVKGGLKSSMNYYRAVMTGANVQDDEKVPEEARNIRKPTLFIATTFDEICTPALGKAVMDKFAPQTQFVELATGHWPQLEDAVRVNEELQRWVESLNLGKA